MSMDYVERGRRVLALEREELERLEGRLDGTFGEAVRCLQECVERKGKVVVCGMGKSGCVGEKIAATLASTGCPAVVLNAGNALHGDVGMLAEEDVLVVLSYSGETEEIVALLPAAARLGVPVMALTGNPQSSLGRSAAVVLNVAVSREACPLELAPTSSTTVMLAMGDALAMVLLEARGVTREDFARYHPSGSLGRSLLLRVSDVMRGREQMALVNREMTVRTVLAKMTALKAGAAVSVDAEGRLEGVFTHGDFARWYQADPEVGDKPVGPLLTVSPVSVEAQRLAAEVLRILEKHRVDEVVVLDVERRPVGVVDSQDLARWRLI
jgi:arabinose-5-phosphate isomerase